LPTIFPHKVSAATNVFSVRPPVPFAKSALFLVDPPPPLFILVPIFSEAPLPVLRYLSPNITSKPVLSAPMARQSSLAFPLIGFSFHLNLSLFPLRGQVRWIDPRRSFQPFSGDDRFESWSQREGFHIGYPNPPPVIDSSLHPIPPCSCTLCLKLSPAEVTSVCCSPSAAQAQRLQTGP